MKPLNHYQSKKKTLYLLLLIWTMALLLASPVALFYKFIWVRDRALGIKPYCTTFNPTFTLTFFKVRNLKYLFFGLLHWSEGKWVSDNSGIALIASL